MKTRRRIRPREKTRRRFGPAAILSLSIGLLAGCPGPPDRINVQLRKDKQALEEKVASLTTQSAADRARIAALEKSAATAPVLPQERLDRLVTVHSIQIGRLTHWADDGKSLKVYLSPLDADGDTLKAAGSWVVEAFDLSRAGEARIGRWEFEVTQCRGAWVGVLVNQFVFACALAARPEHADITVKVTFRDELTGRVFVDQRVVRVPARQP
jgi:hypothetical protein